MLSGVTHMIPQFVVSSSIARRSPHRDPLGMSSDDTHGSTNGRTTGNQSRRERATEWLTSPDQLMKIFMPRVPTRVYGMGAAELAGRQGSAPGTPFSQRCRL